MYISAYTRINEIVISYTIVHTQHNTWKKKNIHYIGPVKQGGEKWRDELGLLRKKKTILGYMYKQYIMQINNVHKGDGTLTAIGQGLDQGPRERNDSLS